MKCEKHLKCAAAIAGMGCKQSCNSLYNITCRIIRPYLYLFLLCQVTQTYLEVCCIRLAVSIPGELHGLKSKV